MKVIMIGGYPGSGKSYIVKLLIEKYKQMGYTFRQDEYDTLLKYITTTGLTILGTYEKGEKFPGTDRLPMNVQPTVENFLMNYARQKKDMTVLMEGDRLFNEKMIMYCTTFINVRADFHLYIVQASQRLVEQRREGRSEQNASWRKGRETKVNKISLAYPVDGYLQNDTQEDAERSAELLIKVIKGEQRASSEKQHSKIHDLWS